MTSRRCGIACACSGVTFLDDRREAGINFTPAPRRDYCFWRTAPMCVPDTCSVPIAPLSATPHEMLRCGLMYSKTANAKANLTSLAAYCSREGRLTRDGEH